MQQQPTDARAYSGVQSKVRVKITPRQVYRGRGTWDSMQWEDRIGSDRMRAEMEKRQRMTSRQGRKIQADAGTMLHAGGSLTLGGAAAGSWRSQER